jgi:ADP-ribosylglycohydrolase
MTTKQRAAVMGAFAADALSLGGHWVYNTRVIDKKFGRVEGYHDPLTSYHKGKKAGDFTHYGDQTLVLLESIAGGSGYDTQRFARAWQAFFADYSGYFDQATKATLENMQGAEDLTGSGSNSDDLAGAARMAPLIALYPRDLDGLIQAACSQAAVTHNNDQVVAAAEFFARSVFAVFDGQAPAAALETTLNADFANNGIAPLIQMGLDSRDRDTREAIAEFGQMCSVEAGLPSAVHLIARHENNYRTAMIENVMAGGDSSARGMLAGMVLGAAHGLAAIPDAWQSEMSAGERINQLLNQM